jgi:hypothetical protein
MAGKDFSLSSELVSENISYDLSHMKASIIYNGNEYSLDEIYNLPTGDKLVSVRYYDDATLDVNKELVLTLDNAYGEIFDYPIEYVLKGGTVDQLLNKAVRYVISDDGAEQLANGTIPKGVKGFLTLITYDPTSTHDDIISRARNYISQNKRYSHANCGVACSLCKCKRVTDRWKQNCSSGSPYGQPICTWIDLSS